MTSSIKQHPSGISTEAVKKFEEIAKFIKMALEERPKEDALNPDFDKSGEIEDMLFQAKQLVLTAITLEGRARSILDDRLAEENEHLIFGMEES